MSRPLKKSAFAQGLYEISSTQKERIGTLRITHDGRTFRYAKAGASNLSAGHMGVWTAPNSGWVHKACPVTAAGKRTITLTVTAGGTLAANQLEGGLMIISGPKGGSSIGYRYQISGNKALASGETTLYVTLEDPLMVALTASDYFTLAPLPWSKVVESATEESQPAGIPIVDVTAAYYYWCQTKGLTSARLKITGTIDPGESLYMGVSAGFLTSAVNTVDHDIPIVGKLAGLQRLAANSQYAWPVVIDVEA